MKKAIKLLAVCSLLAILCVSLAFVTMADDETVNYTGSIDTAKEHIAKINAETDTLAKAKRTQALDEYLLVNPIDPESEGYDEFRKSLVAAIFSGAKATFAGFDINAKSYECATILRRISRYTKIYPEITELADFAAFKAEVDEATVAYEAKVQALKDALVKNAGADEFSWDTDATVKDMENGSTLSAVQVAAGTYAGKRVDPLDNDNSYYTVDFSNAQTSQYTYMNENVADTTKGFVFEFEYSYFKNHVTDFSGTHGEDSLITSGGRCFPLLIAVVDHEYDAYGNRINRICGYANKGTPTSKDVYTGEVITADNTIVAGEWTHIMMIYEPVEKTCAIYVDYEYVTTTSLRVTCNITNVIEDYNLTGISLGCQLLEGDFAIDNVKYYRGTTYRPLYEFDELTDEEKFAYYLDFLDNDLTETRRVASIEAANLALSQLLPLYYNKDSETGDAVYSGGAEVENSEIRKNVDKYLAFDISESIGKIRSYNSARFVEIVNEALTVHRSFDTLPDRRTHLSIMESFLNVNTCDLLDEGYKKAYAEYEVYLLNIERDTNSQTFLQAMQRFEKASTYNAKLKHYADAKALATDPEKGIDLDINDPSLDEAYLKYLNGPELLEKARLEANSKILIACANILKPYDTETLWKENYKYIFDYIENMRKIIQANDYDATYTGARSAVATYNSIYPYFFRTMQATHINYLQKYLDLYNTTTGYIDRLGYCRAIENYLLANDVDRSNPTVMSLLAQYENYREELLTQEDDYTELIALNTTKFINAVRFFDHAQTFEELVALYDEATDCAYKMSIGSPEVQAALEIYLGYEEYINRCKTGTAIFVATANSLETITSTEQKYKALALCYSHLEDLQLTIEGAADAKNKYDAAVADYNSLIGDANAELAQTQDVVAALRENAGVSRLLKIFIELLTGNAD